MEEKKIDRKNAFLVVILLVLLLVVGVTAYFMLTPPGLQWYRGGIWFETKVGESKVLMATGGKDDAIWFVEEGDTKIPTTFEADNRKVHIVEVIAPGKIVELSDFARDANLKMEDRTSI